MPKELNHTHTRTPDSTHAITSPCRRDRYTRRSASGVWQRRLLRACAAPDAPADLLSSALRTSKLLSPGKIPAVPEHAHEHPGRGSPDPWACKLQRAAARYDKRLVSALSRERALSACVYVCICMYIPSGSGIWRRSGCLNPQPPTPNTQHPTPCSSGRWRWSGC